MVKEKEHKETQALLPWYINDTLTGADADLVFRHLADCQECQQERDRLYQLQTLIRENDSTAPGYELSYRRVLGRVEVSERNKESTREVDFKPSWKRMIPAGIAATLVSILVAGAAWFNVDRSLPVVPQYQTLSSDQPNTGVSHRLELGFHNPIPAVTMRQALIETGSNIVSGPDENGNYLVEVIVPNSMTDVEYLAQIRGIDGVIHARFTRQ